MVGIIIVTGILLLSSHHLLLAEASLIAEPPFTVVWYTHTVFLSFGERLGGAQVSNH